MSEHAESRPYRQLAGGVVRRLKWGYARFPPLARISLWVLVGIAVIAMIGPYVTPYDPYEQVYDRTHESPSIDHPGGTDQFGRDVMTRMVHASAVTLQVALGAVLFAFALGIPLGLIAGYIGGKIDDLIMRWADVMFSFPSLILAIAIVAVFGSGVFKLIFVIGFVYSPQYARLIRGEVLSTKEEPFIEAAEGLGYSDMRIMGIEILPNILAPVFVQGTFHFARAMLSEAALSYLGLGINPPTPSWGNMIREGEAYLPEIWWVAVLPGIAIIIVVMAINFLGDATQDLLDPHSEDRAVD